MFPKARVKRFNEEHSCAPPPGHYEPADLKKKNLAYKFEKCGRFQEPVAPTAEDPTHISSTSSLSLPGFTSTPFRKARHLKSKNNLRSTCDTVNSTGSVCTTDSTAQVNLLNLICDAIDQVESDDTRSKSCIKDILKPSNTDACENWNNDYFTNCELELASLADEVASLKSVIVAKDSVIDKVQVTCGLLESDIQNTKLLLQASCEQLKLLHESISEVQCRHKTELQKLERENDELRDEIAELKSKYSILSQDYTSLDEILKKERDVWESEGEEYDLVIKDLMTKYAVTRDEKAILVNTLEVEKLKSLEQLSSMRNEMEILRSEYIVSNETVKHLNDCLTNVERESRSYEQKSIEYSEKNENLLNENNGLKKEISERRNELNCLEIKFSAMNENKVETEKHCIELEALVVGLQQEITKQEEDAHNWESLLLAERKSKESIVKDNEQNIHNIAELNCKIIRLQDEVKDLEDQVMSEQSCRLDAAAQVVDLRQLNERLTIKIAELERKLSELNEANEKLQGRANHFEKEAKEAEYKLESLQNGFEQFIEIKHSLYDTVAERNEEIEDLLAVFRASEAENKKLKDQIVTNEDKMISLNCAAKHDQDEIDRLKGQLKSANVELLELSCKNATVVAQFEKNIDDCEKRIVEADNKHLKCMSELEFRNSLLSDQLTDLSSELKNALESKRRGEEKICCLEDAIQDLNLDVEQLRQELNDQLNSCNELEICLDQNNDKLADLEMELDFCKRANMRVESEHKVCMDRITGLVEDSERLVKLLDKSEADKEGLEEKVRGDFEEHIKQLQNRIASLQDRESENVSWKDKFETLQSLIQPFQNQLELYETEKEFLHSQQTATQSDFEKLLSRYTELLGHQNHKQKIKYVMKLKHENVNLRQEIAKLKENNLKLNVLHKQVPVWSSKKGAKENLGSSFSVTPRLQTPSVLKPHN